MRNKGVIIVLTVIITALCLYYLSFTFVSRNIQKEAIEYATDSNDVVDLTKKQNYLDSVWNVPVYNFLGKEYTYKEVKDSELNLGLDLQGGMHVTLEVSPVDILKGLSGNNKTPQFLGALEKAKEMQKSNQGTFASLFYEAYREANPSAKLSNIFNNSSNKERGITSRSTDDEVMKVINDEIDEAIDRSLIILRSRIDQFGTSQPNIQRLQGSGRIQVEIPGADNPERVRKLLQGVAKLEFWKVADGQEVSTTLFAINNLLVEEKKLKTVEESSLSKDLSSDLEAESTTFDEGDTLLTTDSDSLVSEELGGEDSLGAQLDAAQDSLDAGLDSTLDNSTSALLSLSQGFMTYNVKDTAQINRILQRQDVQDLIPNSLRILWTAKPAAIEKDGPKEFMRLVFVKEERGQASLSGEVVDDANQSLDEKSSPAVSMKMNPEGTRKWKKLTAENIGKQVAVVLDNLVYSDPVIQSEIPSGNTQISGNFTIEEAKDLANILKTGTLPAPTRIVEEAIIGPTLGKAAQRDGITSILAGLVIVVLFMMAYYAKGGLIANVALLFNIFFILGILAQLNAALTLPGIAGIVLTIGMSIDANVLIFERIREEMRNGVKLREAISTGYKKAFSSIFDANITTFLTAAILYVLGQGPVKGFAITLIVGIACSLFSALLITRLITVWMTGKGDESKLSFKTPFSKGLLSKFNYDFMGKRKVAYMASGAFVLVGVILIFTLELNLGVDFTGGRSYVVTFNEPVEPSDMKTQLSDSFEGVSSEVKTFGGNNIIKVTTSYRVEDESTEADEAVRQKLIAGLTTVTGKQYVQDDSKVDDGHFTISSSSKVGATIADDIKNASRNSVIFSLIIIFLYILIRFKRWQFGLGAIIALFHDTLVVLSAFAFARLVGISYEVDQVFIAAILTIIGYSINDTVVVFDRVREFLNLGTGSDQVKTFNTAINSTLNRTLITSLTTLIVVLILFLFGGEVLRGFSFALLVGVVVGTYSSVFIATPIVIDLDKNALKKASEEAERAKERAEAQAKMA